MVFGLFLVLSYFTAVLSDFPNGRPEIGNRTYTSVAINQLIDRLTPLMSDPDMAVLLSNCLPNTLDTTVDYFGKAPEWSGLDSFIITGDIEALWLRDSANQVIPYAPYISQDPSLKALFQGLINRQAHSILIDSFANAFNFNASGAGAQDDIRKPPMKPSVFEGKYELDSLCAFLKLSYWFHFYGNLDNADRAVVYDDIWFDAVEELLSTINVMIETNGLTHDQPYLFQRLTTVATDTLMMSGRGPPAKLTGLSRQLFRPSDDAVTLPYNIPGNAMACAELNHLISLLETFSTDDFLVGRSSSTVIKLKELLVTTTTTRDSICEALDAEFARDGIIPYELDGHGSRYYMDDANVPSLLSLPVLGYMNSSHPLYRTTRDFILSLDNPYFFSGPEGHGVGGPHEGYNLTWPMAIITVAMTSSDDAEIMDCLHMLKHSARQTGFMHEAFNVNDVNDYTRSWFAWANGLFGELILQLILTKPHLVIKNDPASIALAQSYVLPPVSLEAQRSTLVNP